MRRLTYSVQGRYTEYRLDGILLERLENTSPSSPAQAHMVPVMEAIRRYHPHLDSYIIAQSIWRNRCEEKQREVPAAP